MLCSEFDAGGPRQHAHAAFGQAIRGVAGHWPVFMHRADVDDAAAATLLDHLFGRDLRAKESALEIDRHYLFILILSGVEDRAAGFDPGVVHHDVQPTEPAHRLVDEHLKVGDLADIGFHANRLITELADLLLERRSGLWVTYIVDDDIGMQPGQFENNRLAYPAVATVNNRDLALQ